MEEENYTKKGIRSGVTFSFYSSPPLLFNFYDVLPYFYYASRFMIEYVMEENRISNFEIYRFRWIRRCNDVVTNHTKI